MRIIYIVFILVIVFIVAGQSKRVRLKRGKKRCYQVYSVIRNKGRCSGSIGRYTIQDCCSNGGQAYRTSVRGKRKCVPCSNAVSNDNWSSWGRWSKCNVVCGEGVINRERRCLATNGNGCSGKAIQTKSCVHKTIPNCPVHGGWSSWGDWSACSQSCGEGGRQLRFRSCTNPEPKYGGQQCQGDKEQGKDCDKQKPCPIHGEWGPWGQWGKCNVNCDIGYRTRTRKCDNPEPRYGGRKCNQKNHIDKESCDTGRSCSESSSGSGSGEYSGSGDGGSGDNGGGSSGDVDSSGGGSSGGGSSGGGSGGGSSGGDDSGGSSGDVSGSERSRGGSRRNGDRTRGDKRGADRRSNGDRSGADRRSNGDRSDGDRRNNSDTSDRRVLPRRPCRSRTVDLCKNVNRKSDDSKSNGDRSGDDDGESGGMSIGSGDTKTHGDFTFATD